MSDVLVSVLIIDTILKNETDLRKRERKRIWAKEWLMKRGKYSHTNLLKELDETSPVDLKNFLRMNSDTYQELLLLVKPFIEKKNTCMRDAITPNERLSATLRYLASGASFEDLKFLTAIAPQTLGRIMMDTCKALINVLKTYIKFPKIEQDWKTVANGFDTLWNFPHCIGSIDGKHVEINKPPGSGTNYFNYKKTCSIVLMAIVNAKYEFHMVEVGANGRISDGGVFNKTKFYEKYDDMDLNLPEAENLPSTEERMPFVFVADDAFPLTDNLMKPYRQKGLTDEQDIFNYRLSRSRRTVENTFDILACRFRLLLHRINVCPKKASIITLTCCYLHNFLKTKNPNTYLQGSVDIENTHTGEMQRAPWRLENRQFTGLQSGNSRNSLTSAKEIRNKFCLYFNGVGAVPWQRSHRQQN